MVFGLSSFLESDLPIYCSALYTRGPLPVPPSPLLYRESAKEKVYFLNLLVSGLEKYATRTCQDFQCYHCIYHLSNPQLNVPEKRLSVAAGSPSSVTLGPRKIDTKRCAFLPLENDNLPNSEGRNYFKYTLFRHDD